MTYTHNSTLKKGEPAWSKVNKKNLPDNAFADTKGRRYPHHWVSGGKMYLHRGGLTAALQAAGGARSGKQASSAIKGHLNAHKKAIGLGDKKKQSENIQVDINAFNIQDPGDCSLEFKESSEGEPLQFRMVGYSGGIIKNHWWWGNLAIDLKGIKFGKPKFPILRDHMTSMELAFTKKPQVSAKEGLVFTDKEVTFLENEEVDKFVANSKKGFPYQASISGSPTVIERIEEGATTEVNGITLKGPGTVWRKTDFRECSICVFGYDDKTSAQAFSSSGKNTNIEVESIGVSNDMEVFSMVDLEKLKEESPDEYEALMAEVEEEKKTAIDAAISAFKKEAGEATQTQLEEKDREIADLSSDNDDLAARVLSLEKKDTLRAEASLDSQAKDIWLTALSLSGLAKWLYPKVKKQVTRKQFMVEGKFDEDAFAKAVADEITDWETQSAQESEGEVEGFSIINRETEGNKSKQLQADTMVERMLGYVGQTSEARN